MLTVCSSFLLNEIITPKCDRQHCIFCGVHLAHINDRKCGFYINSATAATFFLKKNVCKNTCNNGPHKGELMHKCKNIMDIPTKSMAYSNLVYANVYCKEYCNSCANNVILMVIYLTIVTIKLHSKT